MAKPKVRAFKVKGNHVFWECKDTYDLKLLATAASQDDAYKIAAFVNELLTPEPKKEDENLPNQMSLF